MTSHQLIFTSCRRGIIGVNDGQQIYSYDADFPENLIPRLTSTMTYKGPDLPMGVAMSDVLVPDYPTGFSYECIEPGLHHLVLKTYLGKDYMGPTGRFGNFLSHHVVSDEIMRNPLEFYGSAVFRTQMSFDEVNNPDQPDYLPPAVLTPGSDVSLTSVAAFLEIDGRWRSFTRMAACLLAGDDKAHRLIVRDHPGNVVQWIAALIYLLPRPSAECISFSTYEYDPMSGDRRVVGAVADGTAYKPDSASYQPIGSPYVFDLIDGIEPALDLPPRFADFVEAGLLISQESLLEFQRFVEENFPRYVSADTGLYGAQALHLQHIGQLDAAGLPLACGFLSLYGTSEQQLSFVRDAFARADSSSVVQDLATGRTLLELMNAATRDVMELLDMTFFAEGHLLDQEGAQAAVETVWTNFCAETLRAYPDRRVAVYRQLISDRRLVEAQRLFSFALSARPAEAQLLFDELMAQLQSPEEVRPFLDTYYAQAVSQADREHLVRFILARRVSFDAASELMDSTMSTIEYGQLSADQVGLIEEVWEWALASEVDLRRSPRLWSLAAGVVLTSAKDSDELMSKVDWIVEIASSHRLMLATDDPSFTDWVLPNLLKSARTGRTLHRVLTKLGIRPTQATRDLLFERAVAKFDPNTWLKVAECVYSYDDERILSQFADACKRLSNRELALLQQRMTRRYANSPEFMQSWKTVYAGTQTNAGRMVKAWIGRRGRT